MNGKNEPVDDLIDDCLRQMHLDETLKVVSNRIERS